MNAPVVSPPTVPDGPRPIWPSAAQVAAALILMICLAALGWTAYQHRHAPAGPAGSNDYVIDLNQADHAELLQLPGVGESLASRIEAYRDKHGSFQSVNELTKVRGIGPVTLARLSPYLRITNSSDVTEPFQAQVNGKASTTLEPRRDEGAMEKGRP